jgi:hypothetical protein
MAFEQEEIAYAKSCNPQYGVIVMKYVKKPHTLSLLVSTLAASQAALALPPTTPLPDREHTIYLAGGAAQDPALDELVRDNLALPGSFDVYYDSGTPNGARYRAYFFTTDGSKIPGLSGTQNVLIYKRSNGGAGYGVVPLIQDPPPPIKQLDFTPTGSTTLDAVNNRYVVSASQTSQFADAGITGVNPQLLYGGNYPQPVGTGVGDTFSSKENVARAVPERLTVVPAGGLTFGLAVTRDLYRVLQAAQVYSGTLPADTPLDSWESAERIPTLTRQFVGSLLAGKIRYWDQVKVFNPAGIGKTLPEIAADNGIPLPTLVTGKVPVSVGNRNSGAAIGAAFSAVFLNFPGTAYATPPATQPTVLNASAAPFVTQAPGASQQEQVLLDWQNGTNLSNLNPGSSVRRWGVAQQSTDWNPSYAKDYRYVRIDGYTPTLDNVQIGGYPAWTEQTLQWRKDYKGASDTFKSLIPRAGSDKQLVLNRLASIIGSAAAAGKVNLKLNSVIGPTGLFAVSTDASIKSIDAAFDSNNPVIPYSYTGHGNVLNDAIKPTLDGRKLGATGTVRIQ